MGFPRRHFLTVFLLGLAGIWALPARATEKEGMPDLAQVDQTCFPTAAGNLMVWFGHNGYPNLIASGDSEDERDLHTIHLIMGDTDASFYKGTRQSKLTLGIQKFVRDAGYDADVEYRGLDYGSPDEKVPLPLTEDWLYGNDDPNKGYILLFSYCMFHPDANCYTDVMGIGHAVTLVNAEPGLMLIHDPAHDSSETGRKILTPTVITSGDWRERGFSAPVTGLMLVSGSLLEAPFNSQVMLTGAICVTMHPPASTKPAAPAVPSGEASPNIAGSAPGAAPASAPAAPKPDASNRSWLGWFLDLFFGGSPKK
ncbi:MAG TPA: hypothetical protein VL981_03595 [Candidatus Methylacidiphilales bacterium]|nr:hypothetical protein [Candidatus Methylacidiphilales bacterium]